jgi:hypothetical protein
MKILISVPGISFEMVQKSRAFTLGDLVDWGKFEPTQSTLDVFPAEMKGLYVPGLWSVGIPHWPMAENGTNGIAGPGLPKDELYVPDSIKSDMEELCGRYDKWRPYPAESASPYTVKMARKFSTKRGKAFEHIARFMRWETLFWVEHAPASLAHVAQSEALSIMDRLLFKSLGAIRSRGGATFVFFSPYGLGGEAGFSVSNRLENRDICTWQGIRNFLNGKYDRTDALGST